MIISVITPVYIATLRDTCFKGQTEKLLWHSHVICKGKSEQDGMAYEIVGGFDSSELNLVGLYKESIIASCSWFIEWEYFCSKFILSHLYYPLPATVTSIVSNLKTGLL